MIRTKLVAVLAALTVMFAFMCVTAQGAEKETSAKVEEGKLVKLHYTLTVDGDVIDSSADKDPLELKVGSGQVIPGFEKAIMGMKTGEKKSFEVSPKDGYGEVDPEAFQEVSREKMPEDLELKEGMVLYAQAPDGQSIPARVSKITDKVVVMDFNHPLAGKTLNFEVEIVSVN
jgi:FKBP-type peptidyl-prolyl cis-trans isomerase 2